MMMFSERMQAKRERQRERRREKRENKKMKLLFGMLGTAINASAPRRADEVDVKAVVELLSSDESMSSIDSQDSPPTKRLKLKKGKKDKKKED